MMNKSDYFAEVIQSSLDNFIAQSWQWNFFPKFGSLVEVEDKDNIVLGVVSGINTGSMDPLRYPFPYQKTEEELLQEQPQIFEFLKTTFTVRICGFLDKNNKKLFYILPSKPCKIHAFVKSANKDLVTKFFDKPNFLNLLFSFSGQILNVDELLLAVFKSLFEQKLITKDKIYLYSEYFSFLTGNDYRRIKLFLRRIEAIF